MVALSRKKEFLNMVKEIPLLFFLNIEIWDDKNDNHGTLINLEKMKDLSKLSYSFEWKKHFIGS
jgi:hypothetical protein